MPLWLIGMMGSGKTAVGERAARLAGVGFADTDREVERTEGRSIAELWAEAGEEAFRSRERDAVRRLAGTKGVVATGGGAVGDRGSTEVMRSTGLVIWLDADPAVLARRVGADPGRPLLAESGDPVGRLATLAAHRAGSYAAAAHARIMTDHADVDEIARKVVRLWIGS